MAFEWTICVLLCACGVHSLKLERVLIFSRHSIRQPLAENLQQFGTDIWPNPKYKAGELTTKGAVLERYMGEYISSWLRNKDLLPRDCPDKDTVHIYANTRQRTRETAKAFVEGAFPSCDVAVYSIDSEDMDPIFYPVFRNSSQQMKDVIIGEMKTNLDKVNVNDAYLELDKIINLTNTSICKEEGFCSFADASEGIFYEINKEPDLTGPLRYGNSVVDAYLMAYYEGTAMEDIAHGQLKTLERLDQLGKITRANQIVRFRSPFLAREVAKPLLNYIYEALFGDKKFILMVGHDSNIQSLLAALDVIDYELPDQIENTPIGGKLVFQKWIDEATGEEFLKINYVYQTMGQLRDGAQLSEEHPPRWVDLELATCSTDVNGFIAWKCFITLLENIK